MSIDIDGLWDFHNVPESENRFRAAIQGCEDILEEAELRTQLARTLGLQKRFDECERELERAEELVEGSQCRASVRASLERGRCLNSSGDAPGAIPFFERARRDAALLGEVGLEIDAIHMLAIADSQRALDWNLLGIAKAEQSQDPRARRWLASLYNNTGWSLFDGGKTQEALQLFQKAVPIREGMGDKANTDVARWCVARALRELGRRAEAILILRELLATNPEDAFNNQEMALCLVGDGSDDDAKLHAQKALSIHENDPWMLENRADIITQLRAIVRE